MIVYHVAARTSPDYLTRREPHRQAHIHRLLGLRQAGIVIAGGPAPDGASADLFYRLQQPSQIVHVVEDDPYFRGGAWTAYTPRSFVEFVEPWETPDVVLDGSRRVVLVEGPTADHAMAQFALIELRGAGRVAFGGFFEDGTTLALARSPDPEEALGWFRESGLWKADALAARPYLWVL